MNNDLEDANHEHENSETQVDSLARGASPERPRILFAILVPLLAIVANVIVSGLVTVIALVIIAKGDFNPDNLDQYLEKILKHPLGVPLFVLPGQMVFFGAAFLAARLSPQPIRERLNLTVGWMPKWTWVLMALASPIAALPITLFLHFFPVEPSAQLKMLADLITSQTGFSLVMTCLLISVLPAIVEELLFRGYLQSRLLQRWHPAAAIGLSALVFAIAHVDPMHAMGVFALGIWLGIVAWKSGSVYPAMLGHFANNLLGVLAAQFGDSDSVGMDFTDVVIFTVCGVLLMGSLVVMFGRRPPEGQLAAEPPGPDESPLR